MAELIKATDNLNEGRLKLNNAITDSEKALNTANVAKATADLSKAESESTQTQLDTIVIEGDSSVEAAQARVDSKGVPHTTLKSRIDNFEVSTAQQLAKKADQNQLWNMSNMGQDIKNAMAGDTPVSPDIQSYSISPTDYKLNSVDEMTTSFINKNDNLASDIVLGQTINVETGQPEINLDYGYVDFIKQIPFALYGKSMSGNIVYYDESLNKIHHLSMPTPVGVYETPENAVLARYSFPIEELSNVFVKFGSVKQAPFYPSRFTLKKKIKVESESMDVNSIHSDVLTKDTLHLNRLKDMVISSNVLNKYDTELGYINRVTGEVVYNTGNVTFPYFDLPKDIPNLTFYPKPTGSQAINIAFFDDNLTPLGGTQVTSETSNTVTKVVGATICRASFHISYKEVAQCNYGDEVLSYENYYFYPKNMIFKEAAKSDNPDKIEITASENVIEITTKANTSYKLTKEVKPYVDGGTYQNYEGWRLTSCINKVTNSELVNIGAWETAISAQGLPDFMGTYHGYEKMLDVKFYLNGSQEYETLPSYANGDNLRIIYTANLIKQGTLNEIIGVVTRIYEFDEVLTLRQHFDFNDNNLTVIKGYFAMLPILRNGVTKKAYRETDLKVFNVTGTNSQEINNEVDGVTEVTIFGDNVTATVSVETDSTDNIKFHLSDSEYYNKFYFNFLNGESLSNKKLTVKTTYNIKAY